MRYRVRYTLPGADIVGEVSVEATSAHAARSTAATDGGTVLNVRVEKSGATRQTSRFGVAWWCREVRTLLRSGMTVVEAIDTLAFARSDASTGDINAGLARKLQEGRSLSQAMHSARVFPAVLVAGVTASERTSTLADALDDYLRYHDLLDRLRRQAISAAIYPTLVMSLGLLIVVFLLLFVMPRFSRLYGDVHGQVSWATQTALWLSKSMQNYGELFSVGIVAIVFGLSWMVRRGEDSFASLIERIGPLRRRLDEFRFAKLYQSLALLFRGGYTLDEALEVALSLGLGCRLDRSIAHARAAIARGRSASLSFGSAGLTDAVTERLLAAGERSGAFDTVLQTISDRHATAFATFVERATRVAEPVLLLLVALVVGGIVVMMYMPIFDMAGSLGGGQ